MAFQFASIGAIAPLIGNEFQVDAVAIGALIGIYFVPGIFVALPGGAVASRLGDRRVVLVGLALMMAGSALMASSNAWEAQTTGRLIAGIGGVVLNVVMSKMVMDWFAGREIATAMSVFVNSWPAGIALALIVQPIMAESGGVYVSFGLEAVLAGLGLIALLLFYREPGQTIGAALVKAKFPAGYAFAAILSAGMVWGLFNAALAIVFSFSPTLLVEGGSSLTKAGASTSLVMWSVMVAGILGGFLADRVRRPQVILTLVTLVFALLLLILPRSGGNALVIVALGIAAGLSVGPIMTLPANALDANTRAFGMGLFYTLYYACFSVTPWLSGKLIALTGVARVFDFGAVIAAFSLVFVWLSLHFSRR
jgi:MFS family permease